MTTKTKGRSGADRPDPQWGSGIPRNESAQQEAPGAKINNHTKIVPELRRSAARPASTWADAEADMSAARAEKGSSGLEFHRRMLGDRRGGLDRSSLPTPARYLRDRGLFAGKARAEWVSIRCPAHKSGAEAHPSLRVSLVDGHFRCMTCDAKGHDILALHRLFTGKDFLAAVADLGGRFHD